MNLAQLATELLEGSIDIHVHAGPHLLSSPRSVDPIEAAQQAKDAGMRALVYMDVFENSSGIAWLVSRTVPGIDVFGGIILNTVYGGVNPRAVKTALHYGLGARFVSFGAHSTYHEASREGRYVDGEPLPLYEIYPKFRDEELARAIRIPLKDPVPPAMEEIFQMVAETEGVFINTGHVSAAEAMRVVELAKRYGVQQVLIASPAVAQMNQEQKEQAVAMGAFLERCLYDFSHTAGLAKTNYYVEPEYANEIFSSKRKGVADFFAEVARLGPSAYILATDFGSYTVAPPVEGMRQWIASLLTYGFSPEDVRTMTADNPATLLGL